MLIDLSADKLRVFGDESFDEKGQRVAAVAGLIGTKKEWDWLIERWTEITGGREFHATTWESEFANDPDPSKHRENQAVYRDLCALIADSGIRGRGFGHDIVAAKQTFPHITTEDLYMLAFRDFLGECGSIALNEKRQIEEFVLHNREGREYNVGLLYQYYMERPTWRENSVFANRKLAFDTSVNPRIQAGDLLARETMKYLDNRNGPVRRVMRWSLKRLLWSKKVQLSFYEAGYYQDWKSKLDEMEGRSSMRSQDYIDWLRNSKLSDNPSIRFHFLIWFATNETKKAAQS